MSKQKRKNTMRKPADKMRIVLKGMEPGIDVASLCRQEGISPTQYYTWKKQLVASADAVFGGKRERTKEVKESRLEADLTRIKNVIAEITAENLELKKRFRDRGLRPDSGRSSAASHRRGRQGKDSKPNARTQSIEDPRSAV